MKDNRRVDLAAEKLMAIKKPSFLATFFKKIILKKLEQLKFGFLTISDGDEIYLFGDDRSELKVNLEIFSPEFYVFMGSGGLLGVTESYIAGYWQSNNLVSLIQIVIKNKDVMNQLDSGWAKLFKPVNNYIHRLHQNSLDGSKKNILAHYSFSNGQINSKISDFINVPIYGCFIDKRQLSIENKSRTLDRIWQLGGNTGWYYANWLWRLHGILDKIFGGVGLRRGRTNPNEIYTGDALDFWRVLYANKAEGRLLLFAEMKLPGDAWLEFKVSNSQLTQTATFRPRGLWGRLYWFSVYPFHGIIFRGMIKELI